MPNVPNHNGKDTILNPSVLNPAWYVEQKKGWSSIMATVPTQFGIKEPKKRALEFLMSLDVNDNILFLSILFFSIVSSSHKFPRKLSFRTFLSIKFLWRQYLFKLFIILLFQLCLPYVHAHTLINHLQVISIGCIFIML